MEATHITSNPWSGKVGMINEDDDDGFNLVFNLACAIYTFDGLSSQISQAMLYLITVLKIKIYAFVQRVGLIVKFGTLN